MATLPVLNDDTFETEIRNARKPVLIDFSAPWCAPCRALAPQLEVLAQEQSNKMDVFMVDIDDSPNTRDEHSINSVPTLLLFKDGVEVERIVGIKPKPEIASQLSKFL